MRILRGKRVLLCVGGGIAAYKSPEIVRRLAGARRDRPGRDDTRGDAFHHAADAADALAALRSRRELLSATEDAEIGHIKLAQETDAVLVAPATADLIARAAAGMADDMVTAVPARDDGTGRHRAGDEHASCSGTRRYSETSRRFAASATASSRRRAASSPAATKERGDSPDADELLAGARGRDDAA